MVKKKPIILVFLMSCFMVFNYEHMMANPLLPINIFKEADTNKPGQYLMYCDSVGLFSFNDIYQKLNLFTLIPDNEKLLKKNLTYWLAFKIENQSIYNLNIECVAPYESIEFYYISNQKTYLQDRFNRNSFLFNRNYYNNYPYFTVPCTKNQTIYFLKIKSNVNTGLGFAIGNSKYLFNKTVMKTWYIAIFLGILFITIIYNLIFWIRLRDKAYFYYVGYLVSMLCFSLFYHDLTGSLLGNLPYNYIYMTIPYMGMTICLLLYSSKVLNMKNSMPLIHKIIMICILIRIAIFFVILTLDIALHDPLVDNFLLLPAIYGAFLEILKNNKSARYLIGSLLLINMAYIIHSFLHYISDSGKLNEWQRNGSLFFMFSTLEIIFLSFTLSERFITMKKEKELNQQKLIENQLQLLEIAKENEILQLNYYSNLEKLVEQRTSELHEANEQLKLHTSEILRMNHLLEKDNLKLSHDMQDINKARLLDEELSFSEFQQFYPDERSCLGFVASLKWSQGYECKKCGYKKYYDGNIPYSTICKVCGHFESATTKTLFENVKFPLQKAMYIAYIVHVVKHINVTKLSHQLDLRTATCFNFVKKVYITIEKFKKQPEDWITIIYLQQGKFNN